MPGGWSHVGRYRSISRVCGEYTDYTRSYHHPGAQFWVGSNRNCSVFQERPNTGRHEKAPVRCQCSRLAALHSAPRTHLCSRRHVKVHASDIFAFMEAPVDCTAIKVLSGPSLGHELSLSTSLGRLEAENNCCRQTGRRNANLYIDNVYGVGIPR